MFYRIILLSFALYLSLSAFAQPTIEKKLVLHFEDGVGNRDSITLLLNWNDNCNPNNVWPYATYPELGEIPKTEPFDSTFEVRALKYDYGLLPSNVEAGQYKTLVICDEAWQDDEYDLFNGIYFIPRIKHLPLKMYWDFNWLKTKKELNATWLTNDYTWFIYDGNIEYLTCCLDDENYYDLSICASEYGDTLILDSLFLPLDTLGNVLEEAAYVYYGQPPSDKYMPFPYILEDSLMHEGGKFFPIFYLMRLQQQNPWLTMCNTTIGIAETELPFEITITQHQVIIEAAYAPLIKNLLIVDVNGRQQIQQQHYIKPVAIDHLKKGLYVLVMNNEQGQAYSKKFLKL